MFMCRDSDVLCTVQITLLIAPEHYDNPVWMALVSFLRSLEESDPPTMRSLCIRIPAMNDTDVSALAHPIRGRAFLHFIKRFASRTLSLYGLKTENVLVEEASPLANSRCQCVVFRYTKENTVRVHDGHCILHALHAAALPHA